MKKMTWKFFAAMMIAVFTLSGMAFGQDKKMVVGSKNFTEQRILSQIMIELLQKNGFETDDKTGLGGTLVARKALENGQIDVYMEYTGTALITILNEKNVITDPQECYDFVKKADLERNGLVWLPKIPFNNTYCLMMRKDDAEKKGIKTLSDLSAYVKAHKDEINFGTNEEFYARPDGYKPLQKKYDFQFSRSNIKKMTAGLLFMALQDGNVDVAMGFATDGRIKGMGLLMLEDDQNFFPVYNPAPVVKKETAEKYPELETIFLPLAEKLDTAAMTEMNFQVGSEHKSVEDVSKTWLKSVGLL